MTIYKKQLEVNMELQFHVFLPDISGTMNTKVPNENSQVTLKSHFHPSEKQGGGKSAELQINMTKPGQGWWRGGVIIIHLGSHATPWTVTHPVPLCIGFSRQEHWNGLPFPSPGDLPDPGIGTLSPETPTLAVQFFTTELPGKPSVI